MDRSLQEIMNDVSSRLDRVQACPIPAKRKEPLSEMQAFMHLDPVLGRLNKEYLDAKENRRRAVKDFGSGDGLTDLAAIMEDSAWCAVQTRYIELRADRAMMAKAQSLMRESLAEEEQAARREKEREAYETFQRMQMFERMRAASKRQDEGWLLLALLVVSGRSGLPRPAMAALSFNRLAA